MQRTPLLLRSHSDVNQVGSGLQSGVFQVLKNTVWNRAGCAEMAGYSDIHVAVNFPGLVDYGGQIFFHMISPGKEIWQNDNFIRSLDYQFIDRALDIAKSIVLGV